MKKETLHYLESLPKYNDLEKLTVHQSTVSCMHNCKRFGFYYYILGLVKKYQKPSLAISVGKLTHRLLELDGVEAEPEKVVKKEVAQTQKEISKKIEVGEDIDGSLEKQAKINDEALSKALAIYDIYKKKFPTASKLETLGAELKLKTYIPSARCYIEGVVDRIVRNKENGDIWIRDFKTSGRAFDEIFTGYPHSIQCLIYRLLVRSYIKENNIKGRLVGFILDYIQTPQIKLGMKDRDYEDYKHTLKTGPRKGQVETRRKYFGDPKFSNYLNRVRRWYEDKFKDRDSDNPMRSVAIYFQDTPAEPMNLKRNLEDTARWLSEEPLPANFPRTLFGNCIQFGRVCPYAILCRNSVDNWKNIIETQYEKVEPRGWHN